jgi:hypothetical protein
MPIPEFIFAVIYLNRRQQDRRVFVSITPEDIVKTGNAIPAEYAGDTNPVAEAIVAKLQSQYPRSAVLRDLGLDAVLSATLLPPDGDVLQKMLAAPRAA